MIILLLQFASLFLFAQKQYQLAQPIAKFESVFFDKKMSLALAFNQPGSTIRYTTDGSEPTENSKKYQEEIIINKHFTTIKAKSFAGGFMPSETLTNQFFSLGQKITTINTSPPNPKYPGTGNFGLNDNKSGGKSLNHNTWLGFDSDSVTIDLSLEKTAEITQVLLHVLNNQGAWIFLPEKIEVYRVDGNTPMLLASQSFETMKEPDTEAKALVIDFQAIKAKELRIIIVPLASLPDWHAGKGRKAWFFVDEIKLY